MKPTRRIAFSWVGVCVVILLAPVLGWAQNYSHARIVRLSFVEGTVTIQRPDLPEWASAPVNTPIQEGFKLSTAESSFAEVELENASTARLGQLSLLEFDQLALMPSGGKVNRLTLHQGYATFNFVREGDDVNEVKARDATLTPAGGSATMFRIDLDDVVRVEVFKGSLEVSGTFGSETLTRDMVAEIHPGAEQPLVISHGITKDAWDEWVEERQNLTGLAPSSLGGGSYPTNNGSSLYGWNDLSLFGNWLYFPSFGYGWSPFGSYGWAPYSFGRWCWYPNFGYTWISFEPWGWLPYHYGGWTYLPGAGWCWFPDSFGVWSPAQVAWYQGPGWIGWAPQPPKGNRALPGTGQNYCPQGAGCVTAVSLDNFQNGRPVMPGNTVAAELSRGGPIPQPAIPPTRLVALPGTPMPQAAAVRGGGPIGSNTVAAGAPAAGRTPSSGPMGNALVGSGGVTSQTGIAFDPEGRRYVNGQDTGAGAALSTSPESPSTGSGSPVAKVAGTRVSSTDAAGEVPEKRGPSTLWPASSGAGFSRTGSPGTPRVAPSSGSSGASAPANRGSSSAPSSARTAPTPSKFQVGSSSGSRSSSGWTSGSSGGIRGGGGGISGVGGGGSHGGGSHR